MIQFKSGPTYEAGRLKSKKCVFKNTKLISVNQNQQATKTEGAR